MYTGGSRCYRVTFHKTGSHHVHLLATSTLSRPPLRSVMQLKYFD